MKYSYFVLYIINEKSSFTFSLKDTANVRPQIVLTRCDDFVKNGTASTDVINQSDISSIITDILEKEINDDYDVINTNQLPDLINTGMYYCKQILYEINRFYI